MRAVGVEGGASGREGQQSPKAARALLLHAPPPAAFDVGPDPDPPQLYPRCSPKAATRTSWTRRATTATIMALEIWLGGDRQASEMLPEHAGWLASGGRCCAYLRGRSSRAPRAKATRGR